MLGILRSLCEQAGTSYFNGSVTINDKDLYEHALADYRKVGKTISYDEMANTIYKLKQKRLIRLDSDFVGDDLYHIKEGDLVWHIKLLKKSINY